ncbi:MAG: tetratricopeptide repeat protein [Deltaproteobacteria bacterium]|nr:tetratricopeptide repeat protein [Deltaproteobacteria bacterium]
MNGPRRWGFAPAEDRPGGTTMSDTARILVRPEAEPRSEVPASDDPFAVLARDAGAVTMARRRQEAVLIEIRELTVDNRWTDILDLFLPVEEKDPELVEFGLDRPIREELAFALGQVGRLDEAIRELEVCLAADPNDFRLHASLGYTLYRSLQAANAREIVLHPAERKARIERAERHFARANEILPDRVTNHYRLGKLVRDFRRKPEDAMVHFQRAKDNWEAYDDKTRLSRARERKNYVKALYNLASCENTLGRPSRALPLVETCIREDEGKDWVAPKHKYFALGKVLFALARPDEALKALDAALHGQNPADVDYVFELRARILLSRGEADKGLQAVQAVPQKVRRPYVVWTMADCLTALGRNEEAARMLEASASRDRRSRHVSLVRLARIAYLAGRYEETETMGRQADDFHREVFGSMDPDGLFWTAAACLAQGRRDEALTLSQAIASERPRYPLLPRLRKIFAQAG